MPDGQAPLPEQLPPAAPEAIPPAQPCFGRIVGLDTEGRPRVTHAGLRGPAPVARTVGAVPREQLEAAARAGRPVFLAFLDGRPEAPVIMSLQSMHDLPDLPPDRAAAAEPQPELAPTSEGEPGTKSPPLALEVDGEGRQIIEAEQELVLRCGDAAIVLRADGSVRVTGRDITSWARRRQRIRGGSVAIN